EALVGALERSGALHVAAGKRQGDGRGFAIHLVAQRIGQLDRLRLVVQRPAQWGDLPRVGDQGGPRRKEGQGEDHGVEEDNLGAQAHGRQTTAISSMPGAEQRRQTADGGSTSTAVRRPPSAVRRLPSQRNGPRRWYAGAGG